MSLRDQSKEILARYPPHGTRSALLPLLHRVQERDGYLTQDSMAEVADILGLSTAEVLSVASFYTMFHLKPKGRHVISVCHNIACTLGGAEAVIKRLEEHLGVECGRTSEDGEVTLERAECLAACDLAPMLQIDYDEVVGPVDPTRIEEVLGRLDGEARREAAVQPTLTDVEAREAGEDAATTAGFQRDQPRVPADQLSSEPSAAQGDVPSATEGATAPTRILGSDEPEEPSVSPREAVAEEPDPDDEPPPLVESIPLSDEEEEMLGGPARRGQRRPPSHERIVESPDEAPGPSTPGEEDRRQKPRGVD